MDINQSKIITTVNENKRLLTLLQSIRDFEPGHCCGDVCSRFQEINEHTEARIEEVSDLLGSR